MAHITFSKQAFLIGCLVFNINSHAWQTLIGNDSSRTDQTFSFDIKAHFAQPANKIMLVGAEHANEGKEYALSKISLHDYKVTACAPAQATVDTLYEQPNPLYNAAIKLLVCPSSTHAVVYNPAARSMLYNVNHGFPEPEIIPLIINDDAGMPCENITHLETDGKNTTFAAIKTANNQMCAIAVNFYSEKTEQLEMSDADFKKLEKEAEACKDDPKKMRRLKSGVEMSQDGKPQRKVTTKTVKQESATAFPENIKEITALCWHADVNRLYVGVAYRCLINDQMCGILVGAVQADKSIAFEPFADGYIDFFRDGTIDSITAFTTTTGYLDYILVKNSSCPQQINSFAVCNQRVVDPEKVFKFQGTLADNCQKPQDIFESTRKKFLGRQFNKPFVSAGSENRQLVSHSIGGGYLYAGPISSITIHGDLIFAIVTEPINGYSVGVYQTHLVYDAQGKISGSTFWQKALAQDGLDFAIMNNPKNNMLIFSQDPDSEKGTRTVQANAWPEAGTEDIAQLIQTAQQELVANKLEIKKVIDFSIMTPGVCGKNLTVLMSDTKLVLAQMPEYAAVIFDQDSFACIGTPTCAQIGISNDQGWLFVGGTQGIAKMVNQHGMGWNMPNGLADVKELHGMKAQRVGDYRMVRKLLFDQGNLYVLTDSCLDRINLETGNATRLADIQTLCNQRYAILYDVIISDKCALLATSAGLYRVGNNKNIMHDGSDSLSWTPVQVPDATDLSLFLMPVSISGNPHDWAKGAGQIYIVTGSYTKKGAHVHRFAVQDISGYQITNDTIKPVPDYVYMDRISDIGALLVCSDCFATDGLSYLAPFRQKKSRALVLYNGLTKARTTINLDLQVEDTITCITRNSMHGNWLIAGSFGLKTNI